MQKSPQDLAPLALLNGQEARSGSTHWESFRPRRHFTYTRRAQVALWTPRSCHQRGLRRPGRSFARSRKNMVIWFGRVSRVSAAYRCGIRKSARLQLSRLQFFCHGEHLGLRIARTVVESSPSTYTENHPAPPATETRKTVTNQMTTFF